MYVQGEGTLRVVYRGTCCGSVGGVVPTSTYMTLAPYFALIGLVATLPFAYAVKKRRD